MTKIIGLGHYSRTGKNTLANMLEDELRYRGIQARQVSFARRLKDVCYELYKWAGVLPGSYYETDEGAAERNTKIPALGMNVVELWIKVGNMFRDEIHPDTWLNSALATTSKHTLIVTDVRFENEAEAIRDRGGSLIKVVRKGVLPRDSVSDRELLYYEHWDLTVENDGTLEDLRQQAYTIARRFAEKGTVA